MTYIPKSKVSNPKNTSGGEFVTRDGKEYIGDYIAISDGTFWNGTTNTNREFRIFKKKNPWVHGGNKSFSPSKESREFNIIQNDIKNRLHSAQIPPVSKPNKSMNPLKRFQRATTNTNK